MVNFPPSFNGDVLTNNLVYTMTYLKQRSNTVSTHVYKANRIMITFSRCAPGFFTAIMINALSIIKILYLQFVNYYELDTVEPFYKQLVDTVNRRDLLLTWNRSIYVKRGRLVHEITCYSNERDKIDMVRILNALDRQYDVFFSTLSRSLSPVVLRFNTRR